MSLLRAKASFVTGADVSPPVHRAPQCNQGVAKVSEKTAWPSVVFGCPLGFVDCGYCLCVPVDTCIYCSGGLPPPAPLPAPPPPPTHPAVPTPSTIIGCPYGEVDCGYCLCVPVSTCLYCGITPIVQKAAATKVPPAPAATETASPAEAGGSRYLFRFLGLFASTCALWRWRQWSKVKALVPLPR